MKKLSYQFEEVQLVYRNKTPASQRPKIITPQDAYSILRRSWDLGQINLMEEAKMLMLDCQMGLMSIASISKGGLTETIVDPRIVFSIALKRRAHRIVLAHNHPSGSLQPSYADIKLTQNFMKLGELLRIPVHDHLIVTEDSYCSLVSDGHILRSL